MGVKVYHNGNWVEFSTGSNASADFLVQDEGNDLVGLATALNFKGSGVTASNTTGNPSTKEIEITGVTTFLALSDTPTSYVGTAGSVVTVKSTQDGLEFLPADSTGLGRDNYVSSATFTSLVGGGTSLTLGYTGPDNLSPITADLSIGTIAIGFTQLTDTPSNYTGVGNSFVRVKSTGDGLEFLAQVPSTAVGAAGNNQQIQFNDNGTLAGADALEFHKDTNSPDLILKPASTAGLGTIYGGNITAQSTINTGTTPWNSASLTADGGLELFRTRISSPVGGPYIDFKSQLDGNNNPVDMDARIQMDYANGGVDGQAINTGIGSYSSITFETGGNGHYNASTNPNGRVIERLRIGRYGEIGILAGRTVGNGDVANTRSDADIYGNAGQVLTSNGVGNSVSWSNKNSNTNSTFTSGLQVNIPATQPGLNLGNTVNIANFNSNTSVNVSKLLIYNRRSVAPPNNAGWESTTMNIQRQIDATNFAYIQFGRGNGLGGKQGGTLHFGTGDAHAAVERVEIDPDGYLIAKSDIRVRRTGGVAGTQNNGGIYFGDSNNNYIFGEDSVETLTFNSGGTGDFVQDEQVTATNGATAYVKSWNSGTYVLTIYNRTGTFVDGNTVTGAGGASWVIASNGFTTNDADVLTFSTAASEKLRITKDGAFGLNGTNYGTAGQVLTSGGPNAAPTWEAAGGGGGSVATSIQTYTSATTHTYTPTPGTTSVIVHVVGGGGGAGAAYNTGSSGSGGAGGVAIRAYNSTELGSGASVTVGNLGSGGSGINGNGQNGGISSFNPNGTGATITGGAGSASAYAANTSTAGGTGGTGTNGHVNLNGQNGEKSGGAYTQSGTYGRIYEHRSAPALGGYGQYGLGGKGVYYSSTGTPQSGGAGTGGIVIIYEFAGSGGGGGSSDPVGTIVAWAGSVASIPNEYQLCDGSTAVTATLQTITGTNVPDLRDRFIIGANDVAAESAYPNVGIGSTGGSANAVLVAHSHVYQNQVAVIDAGERPWPANNNDCRLDDANTTTVGVDASGASNTTQTGTNANLPPYYALCYIIKHTATSGSGSGSSFVLLSEKTVTAGDTYVEFDGIPSDALEITLMFKGLSASAGNHYVVQLGTSSGYITTGYVGNSENSMGTAAVASNTTDKPGFVIYGDGGGAELHGSMIINKASSNSYTEIGEFRKSNTGGAVTRGSLSSVSGTVDRLKIFLNGTNTFDAGTMSLSYKTSASGGGVSDKIEEGNTSAEVVDTGTNGHFKVLTEGTEILRIKSDTDDTFANSDNIILANGGGVASAGAAVTTVINMGTTYFDTGTGNDFRDGSGDWRALKLFLYKSITGTDNQTIDNVYGFGVSNGVMEIQTNADLGFFVGSAGPSSGKRTERMRILSTGQINVGGTIATNLKQTTYTMYVLGSFGATSIAASTKNFVIDHPTKENHTLRHGCLEGPENAVYVRGKTSGSVINLPDYWVGLVHEDSITVNLTPIGNKRVWVESINNNIVTTGSDDSTEYFYTIFGERKDIDKIVIEEEK